MTPEQMFAKAEQQVTEILARLEKESGVRVGGIDLDEVKMDVTRMMDSRQRFYTTVRARILMELPPPPREWQV
jgi:Mrp family chromosome partitioning ATPase